MPTRYCLKSSLYLFFISILTAKSRMKIMFYLRILLEMGSNKKAILVFWLRTGARHEVYC